MCKRDYSWTSPADRGNICDEESDGDGACIRYIRSAAGTYNDVKDANGGAAGCSSTTFGQGIAVITQFRTCEDQALQTDPCGPWKYD